jgi:RND family efflux transporter MFP subunit
LTQGFALGYRVLPLWGKQERQGVCHRSVWAPVTLVLGLFLAGCDRPAAAPAPGGVAQSAPAPSVLRVTTVKPTKTTLKRVTEQPGRVEPFEQAPLFSKVAGYVEKVHVDLGDKVEAGQMLVELSVPELQDELKQKLALQLQSQSEVVQAQAAIRAAQAQEKTARAGIAEADAGIERMEALYARAQDELKRIEQLSQMNAVSGKLVDEAKNTFRAAAAGRREAAAKVASVKSFAAGQRSLVQKSEADLTAAQARVQVADANVRQAQTMLAYSKITAPFAGSIASRSIDVGHFIPAGSTKAAEPLLTLVNTKTVRVKVDVPEAEATFTQPEDAATIRVQALPGGRFTGKVSRVSAALSDATRTLRAEIDVPNPEGRLIPGMYVTVSLTVAERPDVLVLPTSAIGGKSDPKPFCYVVESGKLAKRELSLGLEAAGQIEITSDLDPEAQVVKSINASLTEGQPVEIVEPGK